MILHFAELSLSFGTAALSSLTVQGRSQVHAYARTRTHSHTLLIRIFIFSLSVRHVDQTAEQPEACASLWKRGFILTWPPSCCLVIIMRFNMSNGWREHSSLFENPNRSYEPSADTTDRERKSSRSPPTTSSSRQSVRVPDLAIHPLGGGCSGRPPRTHCLMDWAERLPESEQGDEWTESIRQNGRQ